MGHKLKMQEILSRTVYVLLDLGFKNMSSRRQGERPNSYIFFTVSILNLQSPFFGERSTELDKLIQKTSEFCNLLFSSKNYFVKKKKSKIQAVSWLHISNFLFLIYSFATEN